MEQQIFCNHFLGRHVCDSAEREQFMDFAVMQQCG
jgi:hypothetical protein